MYICKKKEGADIISKQFYESVIYDLECQEKLEEEGEEYELQDEGKNNQDEQEHSDYENGDNEFLSNNPVDDNLV